VQAKLLRVLEEQTFRRLGGLKDIQVDLRVITTTHRDLREAIQQGREPCCSAQDWNQREAARILSISRDTLRYRMKKFDLKRAEASGV
jgi:DNA-binding NtrC family response regulator